MKRVFLFFPILFFSCFHSTPVALFNQGNEALKNGDYHEALNLYEKALGKNPNAHLSSLLYYNGGNAAVSLALSNSAIEDANDSQNSANHSQKNLHKALEWYCLAQNFTQEPFYETSVNAQWVRERLQQQETSDSSPEENQQNQEKQENQDKKNNQNNQENQQQEQNSSEDDSTSSQEETQNSKEQNSSSEESSEEPTKENTPSSSDNESVGQKEEASEGEDKALSPEQRAEIQQIEELLNQEETNRQQRMSFQRLPSYNTTEKNW